MVSLWLAIDDPHRGLIVVNDEISNEILPLVLDYRVIPKIFDIYPVPRIGSLEARDSIEGFGQELSDAFI